MKKLLVSIAALVFAGSMFFSFSVLNKTTLEIEKDFDIPRAKYEFVEFTPTAPGLITVDIEWTGGAMDMVFYLEGPKVNAEYEGISPYHFTYEVDAAELKREGTWGVRIVDWYREGPVEGKVKITYPSEQVFN